MVSSDGELQVQTTRHEHKHIRRTARPGRTGDPIQATRPPSPTLHTPVQIQQPNSTHLSVPALAHLLHARVRAVRNRRALGLRVPVVRPWRRCVRSVCVRLGIVRAVRRLRGGVRGVRVACVRRRRRVWRTRRGRGECGVGARRRVHGWRVAGGDVVAVWRGVVRGGLRGRAGIRYGVGPSSLGRWLGDGGYGGCRFNGR